ncbi:MAG TPA: hypothetical protein VHO50_08615 [Bacteroidales bacterium]|nr:hypothetical protein [Bacteroidales bacterium]
MKIKSFTVSIIFALFFGCNNNNTKNEPSQVSADSLIAHLDDYLNKTITTEGTIIHVCSATWRKLKLKTENGEVIMIEPADSTAFFDKSFNKKRIKVHGLVHETRFKNIYVDSMEIEKTLLCHVDYTPCKDTAWIRRQINSERADSISNSDIQKLRKKMNDTQLDYVSVITITADKYEVVQKENN